MICRTFGTPGKPGGEQPPLYGALLGTHFQMLPT
jgi:hypothetical protein